MALLAAPQQHPALLTKACKLQRPDKQTVQGLITLTAFYLTWDSTDKAGADDVKLLIASITSTQRTKNRPLVRVVAGPAAYVFEFDTESDREELINAIQELTRLAASASATGDADGVSKELRQRALNENKDLRALYERLVVGGVIAEAEFWRTQAARLKSLAGPGGTAAGPAVGSASARSAAAAASSAPGGAGAADAPPPGSRRAQGTAFIDILRALADSIPPGTNVLHITPELRNYIFAVKPAVARSYAQNVPGSITEEEFWRRFYKHEKAKEAKRRLQQTVADAAAGASLSTAGSLAAPSAAELNTAAAAIEQDLNAVLFERRLDDQGEERARARAANPLVNLAADQDDSLGQGFGTAHDARREQKLPPHSTVAEEIVRQVNRHAEVVLRASHAATTAAAASTGGGGASTSAAAAAAGAGPSTSAAAGRGAPPGAPLSPSSGPLKRGRRLNVVDVEPDEGQLAELRRAQGQALDDLRPHVAQQFIELDIRDPRTFVSGDTSAVAAAGEAGDGASAAAPYAPSARHHRGGGAGDGPTGGAAVRQHEQPAARKPVSAAECAALLASMDPFAISESPMPNGAADRVLRELTGGRSTGQDLDGYGQPTASPEEVLPRWMREEARSKVLAAYELLRHAWPCLPAGDDGGGTAATASISQAKRDKLLKVLQALDGVYNELEAWRTAVGRSSNTGAHTAQAARSAMRQLTKPAMDAMDVAIERARHCGVEVPMGVSMS